MTVSRASWPRVPLSEVAEIVSGYAFKSSEFGDQGIPAIKIKNLRVGTVDLSEVQRVDEKHLAIPDRYHVRGGDVLISLTGSHLSQPNSVVGRVARHSRHYPECLLNQRVGKVIIKDNSKAELDYLFYALSERETVRAIAMKAHGAANQANVSPAQVGTIDILLPPVAVQRRIACILGAYDALIEANRRRIAVLEEMARRLFEEWFVRYRFPGHQTRSLANGIPEGWRRGNLGDIVEQRRDTTFPGEHLASRIYVPVECIGRRTLALSETTPWTEAQSSLQTFERGDILFGAMRAYFHKVAPAPSAGVTRATCFVLRPRHRDLFAFALLTMFRDETVAFASANSKGSTIPYAQWTGSLERLPIAIPDEETLKGFNAVAQPSIDLITNLRDANVTLSASRDLLLPRLISGDLTVSGADRELEDAA